MTGEKGGLLAALRAEALKSRHAAPVRLAVLMALPMPLLGAMPYRGVHLCIQGFAFDPCIAE